MGAKGRQFKGYAIILRTDRFLEMHKMLTLFIPEKGILRAVAHGAMKPKSRFSGRLELFSFVLVDLDYSPTRDSYSIREIEVVEYFSGIRGEVESRFLFAACWADMILQTQAMNEESKIFNLFLQALRFLNSADGELPVWLHLQFVLRLLAFGGIFPEVESCASCGRNYRPTEDRFLNLITGETFCSSCVKESLFLLTSSQSDYIMKTMKMNLKDSLFYEHPIDRPRALVVALMKLTEQLLGVHFRSFDLVYGALQ